MTLSSPKGCKVSWALRGGCRKHPPALRSDAPGGALPLLSADSSPAGSALWKGLPAPRLNFTRRWAGGESSFFPLRCASVFREKSSRGSGCISLRKSPPAGMPPLTFPPLPVTIRVDGDGVLDTVPAAENIVTTVTHRHALSGSYRKTIFRPSCVLLFQ